MKVPKSFLIVIAVISIYAFFVSGVDSESVEKIAISSAIGYDLQKDLEGFITRKTSVSLYRLGETDITSDIITAEGITISATRERRQTKIDKKFLLGLEKVCIIGEEYARDGIHDIVEGFFNNPNTRDVSMLCVCSGKAEDIMKIKIEGYPSAADFVEGLLKYSRESYFFSGDYKIVDSYLKLDAEGRSLVLPYIKIEESKIEISGLAIFKGGKMTDILPLNQAEFVNLLRDNNVKGVITIEDSPRKTVNFIGKSKRKVECYKEGDKYKFIINLKLTGDVVNNEYDPTVSKNVKKRKELQDLFADEIKKEAEKVLNNMKSDYKVDFLELGWVAAAKYGRNKGVDWHEVISNSSIEVDVTVNIDRYGRGDY